MIFIFPILQDISDTMQRNHCDAMSELFLTSGLIYLYHQNKLLAWENFKKAKSCCSDTTNIDIRGMIDNVLDIVQHEANEITTKLKDEGNSLICEENVTR